MSAQDLPTAARGMAVIVAIALVATTLAPRLQAGHELSYLGVLNQRGLRVTVWKLSFKDGGDDHLVTLGVKDGKVAMFLVR